MPDVQAGDIVLYQPTKRDWLQGPDTPQIVGIVKAYDEESKTASLVVYPGGGYEGDSVRATMGDGDGQFLKVGEKSKTAKKAEETRKAEKEQAEARAKKEEEEAKKAQEESKQPKGAEGIPTAQRQLDEDQRWAILQYKYPQPPAEG